MRHDSEKSGRNRCHRITILQQYMNIMFTIRVLFRCVWVCVPGVLYTTMWSIDNTLSDQPSLKTLFVSPPPMHRGTGGPSPMSTLSLTPDVVYPLLTLPDTPTTPQNKVHVPAPYVPTSYMPVGSDASHMTPGWPRTALKQLNRFPKPTTNSELADFCKPFVPARTKSNYRWAVSMFTKRIEARNSHASVEPFPMDLLE